MSDHGTNRREMKFGVFLYGDGSFHAGAWRQDRSVADAGLAFERWIDFARTLERGLVDMLFIADTVSPMGGARQESFTRTAQNFGFEPMTLLAALSQVTSRIGLAATVSTTWTEPYNTARMLASLDRISHGRSGWNVVTSRNPADALNFSRDEHVEHADRYVRAEEFVDVCAGLWDSYDDDAFLVDRASGNFVDPDRWHALDHVGSQFKVAGPLGVPRPVQGHPVIIMAGQSEPGRRLSGRVADCVFPGAVSGELAGARAFYADLKARVDGFGRNPDHVKVLPGVSLYVGRSRAEAREKYDELNEFVDPQYAIQYVRRVIGVDLSSHPLDGPVPDIEPTPMQQNPALITAQARRENMTLLEFARSLVASKSFLTIVGTADDVADELQEWFESGAADGFNLLPAQMPGSAEEFVDLVVPELQRRGLYRSQYTGTTLRDHLGLPRPALRAGLSISSA